MRKRAPAAYVAIEMPHCLIKHRRQDGGSDRGTDPPGEAEQDRHRRQLRSPWRPRDRDLQRGRSDLGQDADREDEQEERPDPVPR